MKTKRLRHMALTLAIALAMLVMPVTTCMQDQSNVHNLITGGARNAGTYATQTAQTEAGGARNAGTYATQTAQTEAGGARSAGTYATQTAQAEAGGEQSAGAYVTHLIQTDLAQLFAPDVAYAATSSSRAKSIATKDAKSRYRISKTYKVSAKSATYRNNGIWKVTFYGKKSKDKYNYIYYVSKSSGKIMYRKQY